MARSSDKGFPRRRRRSVNPIDDGPGLFDYLDIDLGRTEDVESESGARARQSHVSQNADKQDLIIDTSKLSRSSSMRFISFGSGSSGNCSYLGIDMGQGRSKGILIDAGVEPDIVYQGLQDNRIDINNISGILLTHDHGDHVKYAYTMLRAHRHMVVYTTMRTMTGILRRHSISRRIKDYHKIIYIEHPFKASDFTVTAFKTSHDGTENVGFAIDSADGRHHFVIVTDTGFVTPEADRYLRQANYIVLESNYDEKMLATGHYPEYLKARIAGDRGHLANSAAAAYIGGILQPHLSHLFLCHLSEENNTPQLAYQAMAQMLTDNNLRIGDPANPILSADTDISLAVLPRRQISPQYILRHKTS